MKYYKTFDKPYDLTTGADVATALHGMLDRYASDAPVRLRVSESGTVMAVSPFVRTSVLSVLL